MPEQWVYPPQSEKQELPTFIRALNVAFARLVQLFRNVVRGPDVAGGTTNRLAKWTAHHTLDDSSVTDTGSLVSTANPLALGSATATVGILRLPNAEVIAARNAADSGNFTLLYVGADDVAVLASAIGVDLNGHIYPISDLSSDLGLSGNRFKDFYLAGKANIGGEAEIDGALNHDGTTVGFYGVTPVARPSALTQSYSTASRTHAAYTADNESGAYTGVDNLEAGTVYATVADLNALRVAYENLRAHHESTAQFVNTLADDLQANGLEQ